MSDPYSDLAAQDESVQTTIADAMDARCVDPAQVALRRSYLSGIAVPEDGFAVELGSGTGHVTRDLVQVAGATRALGLEPSPVMVARARQHFGAEPALSFAVGDAKETGLESASVDLVSMHTLLCHVPEPIAVIREAHRILKPGGVFAICDGTYDTTTTRIAEFDPLDQLVRAMIRQNVTNLWIMQEVGGWLTELGCTLGARMAHGYVAEGDAAYFLSVIDRGADKLIAEDVLFPETGAALKAEARKRVAAGRFYGFMSYVSLIAQKG